MNDFNKWGILDERVQENFDGIKNLANTRLGPALGAEFGWRMNKMDSYMKELYMADPEKWIGNYGKWGKLNCLSKPQLEGKFYTLTIKNGKVFSDKIIAWNWNHVLDFIYKDRKIIFWENHGFMAKWENLDYAGKLSLKQNGIVQRFIIKSGHYSPSKNDIEMQQTVVSAFQKQYGLNLNDIPWKDR